MDDIRLAARCYIQAADFECLDPSTPQISNATDPIRLDALWAEISSHSAQDIQGSAVNETLLVIQHVLKTNQKYGTLEDHEKDSAQSIYGWLAQVPLPSSDFASALEARYSAKEDKNTELPSALKALQSTSALAILCIKLLNGIVPLLETPSAGEVLTALASFTSLRDPWTTRATFTDATAVLQLCMQSDRRSRCWPILERICESKIRPIFAKTKNAAITSTGRKNLLPSPRPRFDSSLFDPESKPWKHKDVYATTVLEWILTQYTSSDINRLENHFHLFVPPILSLIDDESASFKYRGCILLTHFLTPLQNSHSDLLRRTNLSSVFDDALAPCLLSLPSITPEEESLHLLGVAYPALFLTLQTRYPAATSFTDTNTSSQSPAAYANSKKDKIAYTARLTTLLRDSIISSFHHTSSYTPTASSSASSSLASFPYPRLSTFLLSQLRTTVLHLGLHSTKYLQEIIPVCFNTLTAPFGTAHAPLLLAGTAVTQALVLNAWPRVWRYKTDLLAGVCQCWANVCLDLEGVVGKHGDGSIKEGEDELQAVMRKLRGTVYLLKLSAQGVLGMKPLANDDEGKGLNMAGVVDGKEMGIEDDVRTLVEVDSQLKDLLLVDVDDVLDESYFFS